MSIRPPLDSAGQTPDLTITLWGFFIASIVIMLWIIVRSDNFNRIWSKVIGKKLQETQFYRIIRLLLVFVFVTSIVFIILVFVSPLLLENIKTGKEIEEQIKYVRSQTDRVLLNIKVSDEENLKFREEYDKARNIFREEKDNERAIKYFKSLRSKAKADLTKQSLSGLITNAYYVSGKHREGLEFICKNYQDLPPNDFRYRFDIHAHLRKIALKEGYGAAEEIVSRLYSKYKRADLSYVWIPIPLAKMEFLKNGYTVFEENYYMSTEEDKYLREFIKRYPYDAFLDHAYYFLHEFRHVIDHYPDSLIINTAVKAAVQKAIEISDRDFLIEYLKKWPDTLLKEEIEDSIFRSYIYDGDLNNSFKSLKKYPHVSPEDIFYHICSFSSHPLSELLETASDYGLIKDIENFIHHYGGCFDKGKKYYQNQDYLEALNQYQELRLVFGKYSLDQEELNSIIHELETIIELTKDDSPSGLLKLGLYLRNKSSVEGHYYNAIKTLSTCVDLYPNSLEAEKSLYLIASVYRQIHKYKESYIQLLEFTQKYPDSNLIDDIIAEIGVFFLLVKRDFKNAEKYFKKVINDYPLTNAADNAINWLAWGHLHQKNYIEALKYYSALTKKYINNRIGRRAVNTSHKLSNVIKYGRKRNTVSGLKIAMWSKNGAYIRDIARDSTAYKAGLKYGDVIVKVNDFDILNSDSFYSALAQITEGETVKLKIRRRRQEEFNVAINVSSSFYYPIPYNRKYFQYGNDDISMKFKIEDFVMKYLTEHTNNDINEIMEMYADVVGYYEIGRISKNNLRLEKEKFFLKWPRRENVISSDINIVSLGHAKFKVSFNYDRFLKRGIEEIKEKVGLEFFLKEQERGFSPFVIISEKGLLLG